MFPEGLQGMVSARARAHSPARRAALVAVLLISTSGLGAFAAESLSFAEMYIKGVLGISFTAKTKGLAGKPVRIMGFMAPPLRVEGNFFVLTKQPVSLCPFCNSDADWPVDIIVVYLRAEETFVQRNRPLAVTGRLELGSYRDPVTGFVSQARLVDATYSEI